ncbi:MAG: nitroreductase family protein [Desulfopila sp.]|jgi:nitroreductase|nr:nitroreductase family protein [Desulfopila sp.]
MFTERRTIRRYKPDQVEEEKLNRILEAARWAPSWANTQCCEVIVIRDAAVKKQLAEILSKKNPASLAVERAPLVIAVCGRLKKSGFYNDKAITKLGDWFMYDLGLATQNICMAAHGEGLGTVIVGAFDHDAAGKILDVPETHEVVALVPLGYPDQVPPAPKRKTMEEFVHWGKF